MEMDGASVAHVCDMNEVPFVVIRSMSDKADGSVHVNFPEFTVKAANNSYAIIDDMLGRKVIRRYKTAIRAHGIAVFCRWKTTPKIGNG